MSTLPVRDFLDLLRHSNLLSAGQLAALAQEVAPLLEGARSSAGAAGDLRDAPQLAQRLVDRNWLTRWQADALLGGQKTFFFGRYRLLERIGTGGMGSVFKARHDRLGRMVALKIMSRAFISDAHAVARFHNEIRAVAALDHPHIVVAFDAGNVGNVQYLVMEYVPGRDLGWYVQRYGKLPIGWACECIRQAALGLQHAHEQGMVHRDVKPTNLLVAKHPETGAPLVKLLDLGLARFADESELPAIAAQSSRPRRAGLTLAGQVLGTPDYMSPEQSLDTRAADLRSDIFSLGCTLFRLLTAEMPYPGESVADKIKARQQGTPNSLTALRPDVPPALIAVVARMMAHDPAARYESAAEVAAELAPFARTAPLGSVAAPVAVQSAAPPKSEPAADPQLAQFFAHLDTRADDEASSTPRPGWFARVRPILNRLRTEISPRVWRRAGAGLVLAVALFGLVWWLTEATLIVDLPESEREGARLFLNDLAYPLADTKGQFRISVRPGLWTMRLMRPGFDPLVEKDIDLGAGEYHIWAPSWKQDARLQRKERMRTLEERTAAAVGGTSEQAAVLCDDLIEFRARHAGSTEALTAGRLLAQLPSGFDDLARASLLPASIGLAGELPAAPPGTLVCVVGDARLKCWNRVTAIAISGQGTRLAAASDDGTVRIFDTATGTQERLLQGAGRPNLVNFGPGDDMLAVVDVEGGISLWNAATGMLEGALRNAHAPLAFDGDGRRLATRGSANDVLIWNVADRSLLRRFAGRKRVPPRSFAFRPQGRSLLVCGSEKVSLLCDLEGEQPAQQLTDAEGGCFSPDGAAVAVGQANGDVRLINMDDGQVGLRLKRGGEPVSFSADGRFLISRFRAQFQTWEVAEGTLRQSVVAEPALAVVSSDAARLATFDKSTGRLALADLQTGVETSVPCGHVEALAITRDGRTVVTGDDDGSLRFFDAVTGRERLVAEPPLSAIALFPKGAALVVRCGSKAEIRELNGVRASLALAGDAAEIKDFVVTPTGAWVVGLGNVGTFRLPVRFWSATSGREFPHAEERSGTVHAYAISADGRTLATSGDDAAVQIWDLTERRVVETLYGLGDRARALSFDPQGRWLAAAGRGRTIAIYEWKSRQVRQLELPASEDVDMFQVEHSPRGTRLVAATSAGAFVCETLNGESQKLTLPTQVAATSAAYSSDGTRLAVSGNSGRVWFWDCEAGRAAESEPANEIVIGPSRGLIRHVFWSYDSRHLLTHNGNGTVCILKVADRRVE